MSGRARTPARQWTPGVGTRRGFFEGMRVLRDGPVTDGGLQVLGGFWWVLCCRVGVDTKETVATTGSTDETSTWANKDW